LPVARPPAADSVECVLMPTGRPDRTMACVSSQIGCAMGCDFCASTKRGLERNLSAGQIAEQFVHLSRVARAAGRRITSVVFMGMGEPMHNLDAVLGGVPADRGPRPRRRRVAAGDRLDRRHRPRDRPAGRADLNVCLAVSLHAPDDATRGGWCR
jgi:23S rRNA (adenine2503-C2)-methyltransferase